jgi:hypothetical protein
MLQGAHLGTLLSTPFASAFKHIFCTHSLESDASNIQRSLSNECFPIDSNVKIAKNTGPLRHSKKIGLDNNKIYLDFPPLKN